MINRHQHTGGAADEVEVHLDGLGFAEVEGDAALPAVDVEVEQRVTLDGQHFFIDLVFYNRLTRCFVLIDLKIGRLTHEDIGQMQMYVNYYQRELTSADENPPLGIILCTDKSEAVVRFTLPEGNTQIFASRYKLHLPTEEELAAELQRERRDVELRKSLAEHTDAPGNAS